MTGCVWPLRDCLQFAQPCGARRPPAAGSRQRRIPGRSGRSPPASSRRAGAGQGDHRMPSSWGAGPAPGAGVGDAGPASSNVSPCRMARAAGVRSAGGRHRAARADAAVPRSDLPAAAGPAARPHPPASEGRAGARVLATQCVTPAACGSRPAAGRLQVAGRRVRRRCRNPAASGTSTGRPPSASCVIGAAVSSRPLAAASHRCGIGGRPTSRRVVRTRRRRERCRASRPSRCRRSRKLFGAGGTRSRRPDSAHRTVTGTGTRSCLEIRRPEHRRGVKDAARPRIARSCSTARAWLPGLPIGVVEFGDLVRPMTSASGCRSKPPRLGPRRRVASVAGASPGCGVSSTSGASTEGQAQAGAVPVGRRRQDQCGSARAMRRLSLDARLTLRDHDDHARGRTIPDASMSSASRATG